jgi:NAD(P)-dependent dehydrogenase (short-subunit alcohol dehydrogenase family)
MLTSFPTGSQALVQGASRGIGLEFVRQLLAQPVVGRVFAGCRAPDRAGELVALAASEPRLQLVPLDVTDQASIAQASATVASATDRLHLVLNCAGILHGGAAALAPEKRLAEVRPEALATSFAVNAFGPLLVARHFERLLAHRERAVFATLSARVGSIGDNRLGGWYAYRGAKAAQNMFTRTLAIEWSRSRRNVVCVALHPGTTDTDLSRPFQANVPPDKLFSPARTVQQLLERIDHLTPAETGRFYAWDGSEIPW